MAASSSPSEKNRSDTFGPIAFLCQILSDLRPYWIRFTLISLMILVQVTFYVSIPVAFRLIFDRAIENNDISFLEQMLGILVAGFVLITAMELIQSYLAAGLGSRVMGNLRIKMFTHLHQVPFGFYSRTQSGDLISRFSNDLNAIDQAAAISIYKIAHHSLVILASIALLFYFEWHLALFSLLSLPLGAIGPKLFGPVAVNSPLRKS